MATAATSDVIGRDEELEALRAFVASLADGPAAAVVAGEAGIGKTTLWRAGIAAASERSFRILAAAPAEAETKLSFAALGDFLDGLVEEVLPHLPEPQARALRAALLLADTERAPPDQRATAVAFLAVLRGLAATSPVLVAVDDIHWLDSPSATVLEFAVRRLHEERVGLLFSQRVGIGHAVPLALDRALPPDRLDVLTLGPLSLGALHRLLYRRLGTALPRPLLQRVHEVSEGNPFFALELGRALKQGEVRISPAEPLALPPTLRELVDRRLSALPPETQEALGVVSALSRPTFGVVARAASGGVRAIDAAVDAQVIQVEGDEMRFAHPLLASAAYGALLPARRRELHRRLADLVGDPEGRARHLALATEGHDRPVADELERAAEHAAQRGAPGSAAELYEHAARITPPEAPERLSRRIAASVRYFEAGDAARARALVEEAVASAQPGHERARALHWIARLDSYEHDRRLAVERYRRALAEVGEDAALRSEVEEGLAFSLFFLHEELEAAAEHGRKARALAEQEGDPGLRARAMQTAMIDAVLGRPGAIEELERAVAVEPAGLQAMLTPSYALAVVLLWTDAFDRASALCRQLATGARERGDESSLPWVLHVGCVADFMAGRWGEAARSRDEAYEVSLQTGQEPQRAIAAGTRAYLAAYRGDVDVARAEADVALELAARTGVMLGTTLARSALGLLELSLGDPAAAHVHLGPLVERMRSANVGEPGWMRFVTDDVEALVELGCPSEAEELLEWFERCAVRVGRVSALATAKRCRGLLADAAGRRESALLEFERALAHHSRVPVPFERGRTLLALGSTQRRANQRRRARESLRAALAIFEELGAGLWTEKTRAELGRIGGRAPSDGGLTPSEERVAALVAEGLTNREVASRLFVTEHTVEAALVRVYSKLGVRSRTELARRLAAKL